MGNHNFIHPKSKLGKNVEVGPFAVIEEDVEIGDGTVIYPNATIMNGARIGKNCRIFPGAVISAIPQDLKFNNEYTTAEIGDFTTIRECVTVNRGTSDRMKTVVGSHGLLMAYVHIAHDVVVGDHCILANMANVAGHVVIDDHVIIEGMVGIQQFVRIGRYSFVSGTSKVRKNIPPFIKVARDPLAYAGVNTIGMKRKSMTVEDISLIENVYRLIFVHNSNVAKGIAEVEVKYGDQKLAREIIEFITSSEKGVIKGMI